MRAAADAPRRNAAVPLGAVAVGGSVYGAFIFSVANVRDPRPQPRPCSIVFVEVGQCVTASGPRLFCAAGSAARPGRDPQPERSHGGHVPVATWLLVLRWHNALTGPAWASTIHSRGGSAVPPPPLGQCVTRGDSPLL